jgi:hypothetical protein
MTGEEMPRTDPPLSPLLPHPPTLVDLPPISELGRGAGQRPACPRTALCLACSCSAARVPGADCRCACRVSGAADCHWCRGRRCVRARPAASAVCAASRWRAGRARNEGAGPAAPKRSAGGFVRFGVPSPARPVASASSSCPAASCWRVERGCPASRSGPCARPAIRVCPERAETSTGRRQEETARAATGCTPHRGVP